MPCLARDLPPLQIQRPRRFCDELEELDLVEPVRADLTRAAGGKSSLTGFIGPFANVGRRNVAGAGAVGLGDTRHRAVYRAR